MHIDVEYIESLLAEAKKTPDTAITGILDKAQRMENLSHAEVATLLMTEKPEHLSRIYEIAGEIKRQIYGNRIVMFAPLYVSDHCVNHCAYCSYNREHSFNRRKLTMEEIRQEVLALERMGHKRLALEAGEHDAECPIEYVLECINEIYAMKTDNGEIRRVNVNIAATTVENYKKLKEVGIGTYILFQETYHPAAYKKVHLSGPKKDYEYHLNAFDRAMEGGIDDVGGGVLFGLGDPYFEVLGLLLHSEHLERRFGAGFHTISVPRICPAKGTDMTNFPNPVDDATFEKLVAIIRLAVPYTGIILSTREDHDMRQKLLKIGVSQLSAGSCTDVGGYSRLAQGLTNPNTQFEVNDERDAQTIISGLLEDGYLPSFCTACYRSGRTGDRFMRLAKSGQIKNVCLPNALMTLLEYAKDYGDSRFQQNVEAALDRELPGIISEKMQSYTAESLEKIRLGQRDFFV